MIQSLLKAANKQQQGQPGGRNSMHPGYTSGTTRNRRTPARSSSWKDCFRREKVAGMIFSIFIFSGQVQNGRPLPKTGRSGRSSRICFSPMTIYFFLEDRLKLCLTFFEINIFEWDFRKILMWRSFEVTKSDVLSVKKVISTRVR